MEYQRLPFTGESMLPVLQPGDQILVCLDSNYQHGDIVLGKQAHEWVAHRLIKIHTTTLLKGDRSTTFERLSETKVWGHVIGYQRGEKTVVWGNQGQPFKKVFAWLSAKNRLNLEIGILDKWRRWTCLIMILALHRLAGIWLTIENQKPFDNYSS